MGPLKIDPKLQGFVIDLVSKSKKRGPTHDDKITLATNKVNEKKLLHEQSLWEYEWEKLRLEQAKKRINIRKRDLQRAEEDQEELLITQNERNNKKKIKIEVVKARKRIQAPENTNDNNVVTNFSSGKISTGKMDTEEIFMHETKTQTPNLEQNLKNALKQKPLVYIDNNGKAGINENEHGFMPQMGELHNFMNLNQEQVNNLSSIQRQYFDKCFPWIMTARILAEQQEKDDNNNKNLNKK